MAALVYDQKSPFYGGSVRDFPTLGMDFPSALADRVNPNLADRRQIPVDMMDQGFAQLGHKPEMLLYCLRGWMVTPADSGIGFLDLVARRKAAAQAALRSELEALTPLQVGRSDVVARDDRDPHEVGGLPWKRAWMDPTPPVAAVPEAAADPAGP